MKYKLIPLIEAVSFEELLQFMMNYPSPGSKGGKPSFIYKGYIVVHKGPGLFEISSPDSKGILTKTQIWLLHTEGQVITMEQTLFKAIYHPV